MHWSYVLTLFLILASSMFPLPESPRSSHFIVLDHFSSYLSQPDKVQKGVKLLPGPSEKLPLLNFFERKYFELHFGAQISWSTHVLHESRVQHDLKNAEFVFFKRKCYEKPGNMQSALGMLPDLFLSSPHTFFFKKWLSEFYFCADLLHWIN